jgi:hypothetical protein
MLEAYALYRNLARRSTPNGQTSTPLWDLVLLGDGPLRANLEAQLSTLNMHGHVHVAGFRQYTSALSKTDPSVLSWNDPLSFRDLSGEFVRVGERRSSGRP